LYTKRFPISVLTPCKTRNSTLRNRYLGCVAASSSELAPSRCVLIALLLRSNDGDGFEFRSQTRGRERIAACRSVCFRLAVCLPRLTFAACAQAKTLLPALTGRMLLWRMLMKRRRRRCVPRAAADVCESARMLTLCSLRLPAAVCERCVLSG